MGAKGALNSPKIRFKVEKIKSDSGFIPCRAGLLKLGPGRDVFAGRARNLHVENCPYYQGK
jgi:hypothetical protein